MSWQGLPASGKSAPFDFGRLPSIILIFQETQKITPYFSQVSLFLRFISINV
jgi:hypothetical protein